MNQEELINIIQIQSLIGFWEWNFKTNKVKISKNTKTILGYTDDELPDEVDYLFIENFIYTKDGENSLEAVNNYKKQHETSQYNAVVKYRHKNGSAVWLMSRGEIVEWDDHGEPLRMIGSHVDITEQKEQEAAALKSKELLSTILNNIPQAVFWKDTDSVYRGYNKTFAEMKGLQNLFEGIGKTVYELPVYSKADSDSATKDDREIIHDGIAKLKYVENYQTCNNKRIQVETSKVPLIDDKGNIFGLLGIFNDVTRQEEDRKNLLHSNKIYHILSHINKLLNNLTTQQQFFDDICKTITETGGFKLAWIGMLEDTTVKFSAYSGSSAEYLKGISVSIYPDSKSYGPTGRCIHQSKVYICNDFMKDDVVEPWRENAVRNNIKSSAAFPILLKGKAAGAITVYEGVENYFQENEIELIQEVVNTIGLGIEKLEQKKEKKQADIQIKRLADIIEYSNSIAGILNFNDKKLVYINNAFREMLGIQNEEDITQLSVYDFKNLSGRDYVENNTIPNLIQKQSWVTESEYVGRTGNRFILLQHSMIHYNEQGEPEFISTTGVDITELKNKENELRKYADELKSLSNHLFTIREEERQIIAKEIHEDLGQNLTALRLGLSWLSTHADGDKSSVKQKFEEVKNIASESVATARRLYNSIYPQMLDDVGVVGAIKWHSTSYTHNRNIKVEIETDLEEVSLFPNNPNLSLTLFRLYTECFSNILWHASATSVTIALDIKDGYVNMMVKDNGRGFLVDKVDTLLHHGITSMRERLAAFEGTLKIESEPEKGTAIYIYIPLHNNIGNADNEGNTF